MLDGVTTTNADAGRGGGAAAAATAHATATATAVAMSAASLREHVVVSDDVRRALLLDRPIVALESTIISHGMPYPDNLATARRVEKQVRDHGAVPATIAILAGKIHVGLTDAQLERLAVLGRKCRKCSRRDLAHIVALRGDGATTVSATMIIAHMVGIPLFATGGIGGVHRDVADTMDVSADLQELARTPVTVVCAGVKSILDIPRTLEYLETQGVTVCALGATEFPAFFTPHSGCTAPLTLDSVEQAALVMTRQRELALGSGMLIAVPIPAAAAAQGEMVERATKQALHEAHEQRVQGRDITPFLLQRINELTSGQSLQSNIALVLNNVKVGAQIAVELNRLRQSAPRGQETSPQQQLHRPAVIGGINQDILGRPQPGAPFLLGTSNPGSLVRHWGGVGRNIAEAMARCGAPPILVGAIGDDAEGQRWLRDARALGMCVDHMIVERGQRTSTYTAILDEKGDLFTTIADMRVADATLPERVAWRALERAPLIVVDGNVPTETIDCAAWFCADRAIPLWFEPTSVEKSARGIAAWRRGQLAVISPSAAELLAMAERIGYKLPASSSSAIASGGGGGGDDNKAHFLHNEDEDRVRAQIQCLFDAVEDGSSDAKARNSSSHPVHIVLKRGDRGAIVATLERAPQRVVHARAFAAGRVPSIVNTSGAGDTLVGTTCWALLSERESGSAPFWPSHADVCCAVPYGMRGAELTLQCHESVHPQLSAYRLRHLHLQDEQQQRRQQRQQQQQRQQAPRARL